MLALFRDKSGLIWIGTYKGIEIFNPENNKIKDITYILDEFGITDKFISAFYEDSRGNYYIGCFLGGGLIKYNPTTKDYKVYNNVKDDETSLSNNSVIFINEDLKGNILIGTGYGLNVLDVKKDTFKRYTEKDGLINNTVYGILVDNNNNIWMSTNGGISKLSTENNQFENFTVSDGLQSNEFNGRSCLKDKDGYMYFGGINGFNIFYPDSIKSSEFIPKVIIDKIKVNGVKNKELYDTNLSYNENNIIINFFTDDYTTIKNKTIKYYYKLNGLHNNWNETKNNSIELVNLRPGDYTLKIKAKTSYGVTGE